MTIEVNPSKFFGTEIMIKNGVIEASVVVKKSNIPSHWSSAVPKKFNQNVILGDLHRTYTIQFRVVLHLKNGVLKKSTLALYSCTISFNLLLILISKTADP